MPTPKEEETKSEFMDRCISIVKDEGKTTDQALGKCLGIWENEK